MTTRPRRRWFRFSLRTMFVVVTVAGLALGWLVWQIRIVRERKTVLAELQLECGDDFMILTVETMKTEGYKLNDCPRIPLVRRILGDEPCHSITIPRTANMQLIERMERAFPESRLSVYERVHPQNARQVATRDPLYAPQSERAPNQGAIFKTGLIEKSTDGQDTP